MRRIGAGTMMLVLLLVIIVPAGLIWLMGGPDGTGGKNLAVKKKDGTRIKVFLHVENKVENMLLEEYIKGVVAAEMPAKFEMAALKAQAVAARTYAVKGMSLGPNGAKDNADVSTDPTKGQAWLNNKKLQERWGPLAYEKYWQKISQAVDETSGEIMIFEGQPIHAVYHSTSGPKTASAQEVWGFNYPYLQSVDCNFDEDSPRYHETKEFAISEVEQLLGSDAGIMAASQSGSQKITALISNTDSGRVSKVRIGSKTFTGNEIREKLKLRSANFVVGEKNGKLIFQTIGYGHGVGMSQYGANGMAKQGKTYQEILQYFYKGIQFKKVQ